MNAPKLNDYVEENRVALRERILDGCVPEPNTSCWFWTGCATKDSPTSEPRAKMDLLGRPVQVARVSFCVFVSPIPQGAYICHKCDHPLCVNPDHLYIGSAKSNAMDMVARGRHNAQLNPCRAMMHIAAMHEKRRRVGYRIPVADFWLVTALQSIGVTQRTIGRLYGVTEGAVWKYIQRMKLREQYCNENAIA